MAKLTLEQIFEKVHEAGTKRHPRYWFSANRAAIEALWEANVNPADPKMKLLVSRVVLKVLDVALIHAKPERKGGSK